MSLPSELEPLPPGLTIIHLHPDPWEIGKNYPALVGILGDPKETLHELEKALKDRFSPEMQKEAKVRMDRIRQMKEKRISELREKAHQERNLIPIRPLALMETVADSLPLNAVVVDETISSGRGLMTFLRTEDPHSFYGMRGGGIGWGIPAALGIKVALPDRPVVALIPENQETVSPYLRRLVYPTTGDARLRPGRHPFRTSRGARESKRQNVLSHREMALFGVGLRVAGGSGCVLMGIGRNPERRWF